MTPPASRRDELLDDLRRRQQRMEEMLQGIVQALTRVEAANDQQKQITNTWFSQTWPAHVADHKELAVQIAALQEARTRAEGAAAGVKWLWKVLAALGLVSGGAAAKHWLDK